MKLKTLALSLSLLACSMQVHAAPAYYRFPSLRGDNLVFTAEGDLWKVGLQGGQAQRLTSHPALETQPSISFDGKWLAFVANYEGGSEAYVMPMQGGLPKRISFENSAVNVLGWTAQGEVLISTQHQAGPNGQRVVATIHPQTLKRTVFPLADANEAVLDESGRYLYFTRFGLQLTNDNVRNYRGGAHAQIWRFDLQSKQEAVNLFATDAANLRRPMWWQGKLYFLSDKDGTFNLWSANPDGSNPQQLSRHKDWEVRNPSLADGKIVYQSGADLRAYDLASNQDQAISIDLLSDFDQQRKRQIRNPLETLTEVELAGRDERLLFTARGRLAIAGLGNQRLIEFAIPENARARNAVFSHDDKFTYAIVDSSGEQEIWKFPANGLGKGEQLTRDGSTHRLNLYPSGDGKWLAHTDKRGRLWLLDLNTKQQQIIDDAGKQNMGGHDEIVWSPDSKYLAIVRDNNRMGRNQIALYALDSKQLHFVTSDRYEARSPVFSPDGRWLYFLSNRNFSVVNRAPWGDRNMGPYFDKRAGLYALALQAENRFPFKADDELSKLSQRPAAAPAPVPAPAPSPAPATPATGSAANTDKAASPTATNTTTASTAADASKAEAKPVSRYPAIQFAGLEKRLYQVPLPAGNYRGLAVDDKRLYFMEQDNEMRATLKTLAISKANPTPDLFVSGIRSFDLSRDGKRIYYRTATPGAGDFYIVDAGPKQAPDVSKAKVAIADWSVYLSPRQEWQQIFLDAWRMQRDFLFDPSMRGVDWTKVKEKYQPLVERVTDRNELNDILAMMAAEVSTLHSQIRPGDVRRAAPEGTPAALGAILEKVADGYRIQHIYQAEPELPGERGPLAQPDLDIKVGDVISRVNGSPANEARDLQDLLLNKADKQVLLHVKRANHAERALIVQPVSLEKNANLRYSDWEQKLSERVNQASNGKIGYLHLRSMISRDIDGFAREFYSNFDRDGLIIDARRNNGGNIDSWIIEKLLRKAWAFWQPAGRAPYTNMQQTFRGHLVVLVDQLTYSDGETFAAGIKALKLAPLVGKRTAGAGVWLSDRNWLADNGMLRAAEMPQFDMDGRFIVEGVGVAPDIEVENLPYATFMGKDQQLETALQVLMQKLKEQAVPVLQAQPLPKLK